MKIKMKMYMTRDNHSEWVDLWSVKPTWNHLMGRWDVEETCEFLRVWGEDYPEIESGMLEPSECEVIRETGEDFFYIKNVVIKGQLPF